MNRNRHVDQVQNQHAVAGAQAHPINAAVPPSVPNSSTTLQAPVHPNTSTRAVKRVFALHDSPECFKLDSDAESADAPDHDAWDSYDAWWCRVVHFSMFDETDQHLVPCPQSEYTVHDLTWCDYHYCNEEFDQNDELSCSVRGVQETQVAAASEGSFAEEGWYDIILDSGADVSVMPSNWMSLGDTISMSQVPHVQLLDAQGACVPHHGQRKLHLDLGDTVVEEDFAATSVEGPLLSLGRLFRQGWELKCNREGPGKQITSFLCYGDEVRIPVFYKRNSPCVRAWVRAVEAPSVRAVSIQLQFEPQNLAQGWQFLEMIPQQL